jgi:uncharacterized protein (TIGR00159 family)
MPDIALYSGWLLNLLDIALLAVIVYRIILLLKAELAIRVLITLTMLFSFLGLARLLQLPALTWLLDNFTGSLFLILVVIFQHDIRRALVSVGRRRFGQENEHWVSGVIIEELVNSCESLATRHIGALIVVERGMSLENYLAVGTEIDAKVTSELISSIFLPYSPIHDGAVIIQKGKLTKAGCFLPLSQNADISKSLGTRHRAAIGLTEVVDAVVIIVSEETGSISVAVSGRITRDLNRQALQRLLDRLLEPRWLQ